MSSNYCYRCHQTHDFARMLVVANVYRDGGRWVRAR